MYAECTSWSVQHTLRTPWLKIKVVSSSFIVIPHAHSHPVSLMSLLNVKFTPFRGLLQNQRLTTALCCGEYANIIRCFWCFILLMNLHDFVTRVITDCRTLFDCLTKDASVPEDRAAALTVTSLRQRCSAGVGRDPKRSGLMWVPTRVQLVD